MAESAAKKSSGFSIDWLVKGTLTKVGDIFDRLTGRGWKPSSSLATSQLIERMKSLMDTEARVNGDGRRYVPHNIKLKMQWDKFSTDSEKSLRKLENEFLVAAVDHINDKHYYTHAPLRIEIKPDYFTSGVMLYLGFEKLDGDKEEAAISVTVDRLKKEDLMPDAVPEKRSEELIVSFEAGGKRVERNLRLEQGRRLSVGRTKENDLAIDDVSVSKAHASLLLNKEGRLVVADTGSTNGTFVRGERIPYGKAVEIAPGDSLMFGLIKIDLKRQAAAATTAKTEMLPPAETDQYRIGEFEFSSRQTQEKPAAPQPAPTAAAIPVKKETVAPIAKPTEPPLKTNEPKTDYSTNIAPQPALSEPDIKLPPSEEK